jgi:hypothetical protein
MRQLSGTSKIAIGGIKGEKLKILISIHASSVLVLENLENVLFPIF